MMLVRAPNGNGSTWLSGCLVRCMLLAWTPAEMILRLFGRLFGWLVGVNASMGRSEIIDKWLFGINVRRDPTEITDEKRGQKSRFR
eukprot:3184368-Rhodomonas_salina.2